MGATARAACRQAPRPSENRRADTTRSADGRTVEDTYCKYLQSSLQIIGFVLVIFSLALTGLDKITTWSPVVLMVLLSLAFSLVVAAIGSTIIVVAYFAQARFRYPFIYYRQLGNSWRWFYYANIKGDTPEGGFIYRTRRYQRLYAQNYADGLASYVAKYVNDPPHQQAADDLRQLFLQMAHDRYKQRFKQHMVHIALLTGFTPFAAFLGGLGGSIAWMIR